MKLTEFRKLAGITNLNERADWTLDETVVVGAQAEVMPDTGTESGKKGRVLSVDNGWAQLRTAKNEMFWVPVKRLTSLITPGEKREVVEAAQEPPFISNLKTAALKNSDFRRVVYTGDKMQFTVMHVPAGGEIGKETHKNVEQVFFCVSGSGTTTLDGYSQTFQDGDVLVVPQGTAHNIVNDGIGPLKFFTSYSPPNHLPNVVHHTKADADADTADEKFGAKVAKEDLDEATKAATVSVTLSSYATTLMHIAKELSDHTGSPMEFYSSASDLVSVVGQMLGRGAGDRDLMAALRKVSEQLAEYSAANRYTNTWDSVPT